MAVCGFLWIGELPPREYEVFLRVTLLQYFVLAKMHKEPLLFLISCAPLHNVRTYIHTCIYANGIDKPDYLRRCEEQYAAKMEVSKSTCPQ